MSRGMAMVEGEGGPAHDVVGDRQGLRIDDQVAKLIIAMDIASIEPGLDLDIAIDLTGHGLGSLRAQHAGTDHIAKLPELLFLAFG